MRRLLVAVVLLTGCVLRGEEAHRKAMEWATQMGYEDAIAVCSGNYCSVRTRHAQNPIPIACYESGCLLGAVDAQGKQAMAGDEPPEASGKECGDCVSLVPDGGI